MLIIATSGRFKKIVAESVQQTIRDAEDTHLSLATTRKALAELQIQQARKEEEWARREREIEHKIGLERKRQEFEIEQSKREATVKVQQENLAADKDRFKSEMDFQRTHLQGEVKGLREMVSEMLKRLPSAEIIARIGGKSG